MVIVRLIWYSFVFEPNFDLPDDEYIDLSEIAESSNILDSLDSIITLFVFACVPKYVMFWIKEVAMVSSALSAAWVSMRAFMFVCFAFIWYFSFSFSALLGPMMISFSNFYYALPFMLQVFLGSWNGTSEFELYFDPIWILIPLGAFFIFKQILWYQQMINVADSLRIARTKVDDEAEMLAEEEEEEVVTKQL